MLVNIHETLVSGLFRPVIREISDRLSLLPVSYLNDELVKALSGPILTLAANHQIAANEKPSR
ncbi:hypothetical protein GCM10017620_31110 [Brevundimonas intermedia]|uniref:Uncharacterized protein n=1 Tax=Brevundimonas intermedia TaxID=74315 RepID=A0ABQ5TBE4_9CAUL|nr:hypothetical protein [Brevundimonas intermedia]GLK50137.1 hypothetical protein GCM10017620_31110 [Brevundimonas intermedia]